MDLLLTIAVLTVLAALLWALLHTSTRGHGVFADGSVRYHEREELGLSGAGRALRSVRPRHR